MKVTSVKPYLVHPGWRKNWLFVKVETDSGIHGWGEAYTQADRDRTTAIHIEEIERFLVGRDPFNIKHFTQIAYDDYGQRRGSMELFSAISGVEQALWDIVGKAVGEPVYRLLGGACRDRVRVYANGWYWGAETEDDFARMAEQVVENGFTALKFDAIAGPWRSYVDSKLIDEAAKKVRRVREVVGPDVDMLIEIHRRLAPMYAVQLAEQIAEARPFWFEEPCPSENLDALAEIRRQISIPVVTGEAIYGKAGFAQVFEKRAADIINPDVANTGGILELKEIAAMAEPHYVAVSPHNYNSTVMALASYRARIRRDAQLPDNRILCSVRRGRHTDIEPVTARERFHPTARRARPRRGHQLDALNEFAYRHYPARSLPTPADEVIGGSEFRLGNR